MATSPNNILNGGLGRDYTAGEIGDDTYVVDNTGDIVVENLNEGWDTIRLNLAS